MVNVLMTLNLVYVYPVKTARVQFIVYFANTDIIDMLRILKQWFIIRFLNIIIFRNFTAIYLFYIWMELTIFCDSQCLCISTATGNTNNMMTLKTAD